MPKLTLALLLAAGTLIAGCKSNETKPADPAPAPAAAASAPEPAAAETVADAPVAEGGFWSVTAYRDADDLLIDNPIDRYCINDRSPFVKNADGSLDLYLQSDPPADPGTDPGEEPAVAAAARRFARDLSFARASARAAPRKGSGAQSRLRAPIGSPICCMAHT